VTTPPEHTRLAHTFEDERYAWTRTRAARHRAVLAEAALLAALVAATLTSALTGAGWTTTYYLAWTVGMLLFIPLHSLLNLGIRGVFDRRRHSLDEHQRGMREHSHSRVGWPMTGLTFTAWAGGIALAAGTGHTTLALCLGFLLWLAASLLPYWHLAWTLPDEDDDLLPA
jgi:membrane protein implicated in regulation of membrane protease activity